MEFYMLMWWLLIIVAGLILLSSLDELIFDIVYLTAFIYHKYKVWKYKYEPLTLEKIRSLPEKKIAIMVACWSEHLVIEDMLGHNIPAIDYKNYDFFIGVYPNDPLTIEAVARAQREYGNIIAITNKTPGPSTKADNLNNVYSCILDLEKEKNIRYEIFIFHDAEDVIHPLSLKLYNYLIPRKDMIQIPVFPLEVSHSYTTHWTYNDEFAENHTKIMLSREVMGGLVPSAGVGTAFARTAIEKLSHKTGGIVFDVTSLTEDYHVSLEIHLLKLKTIFLTQRIERTQMKKKWYFFGELVPKKVYELVATRALYPSRYMAAVRQRARWITGITLQEWRNTGWPGTIATRYTLFHDRKTLITHFINFVAYILFIYWLIYYLAGAKPTIAKLLRLYPEVYYLILACTLMMCLRLFYRAWATYRIYGIMSAILSIPRSVYSNLINFHALIRAYRGFFWGSKTESTKWDKTKNTFPTKSTLRKYTKKLGDLLLENRTITTEQLLEALALQKKTNKKLGKILVEKYAVSPEDILFMLGKQFNMDIIDHSHFPTLSPSELDLSEENYNWLINHQIFPIAYFDNIVTLGLVDPSHEFNNKEAIARIKPHKAKFVLLSHAI